MHSTSRLRAATVAVGIVEAEIKKKKKKIRFLVFTLFFFFFKYLIYLDPRTREKYKRNKMGNKPRLTPD